MDFSLVCLILQVILVLFHFHILYLNTKRNARYEQLRKESDKCFDTWAKERSNWEKRARYILKEMKKVDVDVVLDEIKKDIKNLRCTEAEITHGVIENVVSINDVIEIIERKEKENSNDNT